MSVYQMGKLRIVDLSKQLDPASETRKRHLFRFNTGGPIPDYHTHDVFFMSYSPLSIRGLDSSPVRAYAIEGIEEFSI